MTASQLKLQELTVNHFSKPLLHYLASFSGLQRLDVRLAYLPDPDFTKCDMQPFFEDILPLHGLSLARPNCSSQSTRGLVFDLHKGNTLSMPLEYSTIVGVDAVPDCLQLVILYSPQGSSVWTNSIYLILRPCVPLDVALDTTGTSRTSVLQELNGYLAFR
ncbi:hypothetical protein BDZ97DRAFT_1347657 [Flammula alnicola]|nr:hypothetical protein BDZ97DRAFT_1347657 [Flammula alnicola]